MGIQGLLPFLKPVTTKVHIGELKGLTVGVDAYVWLHRGAYSCASELSQGRQTTQYMNFIFQRMRLLLDHGLKLFIVFDGGRLRMKQGTEEERRAKRESARAAAMDALAAGNHKEAYQHFSRAVDVSPEMAWQWIKTLKGVKNVQYVVAPYEADAQLAYLCKQKLIDAVITDDSDLLAFGCRRVLFKLEADGNAQQVLLSDILASVDGQLDMRGMDEEAFLSVCILSGCDYLPSISGLGIKSAHRLMRRHKTVTKALRALRFEAKLRVPDSYEAQFREALLTFKHQTVFNPIDRCIVHLTPLPGDMAETPPEELEFLGAALDPNLAVGIADGDIDPITLKSFEELEAAAKCPVTADSRRLRHSLPARVASVGVKRQQGPAGDQHTAQTNRITAYLQKDGPASVRWKRSDSGQASEAAAAHDSGFRRLPVRSSWPGVMRRTPSAPPVPIAKQSDARLSAADHTNSEAESVPAMAPPTCMSMLSGWFRRPGKENASTATLGRSTAGEKDIPEPQPPPTKRQRTLGGRPALFSLQRFGARAREARDADSNSETEANDRKRGAEVASAEVTMFCVQGGDLLSNVDAACSMTVGAGACDPSLEPPASTTPSDCARGVVPATPPCSSSPEGIGRFMAFCYTGGDEEGEGDRKARLKKPSPEPPADASPSEGLSGSGTRGVRCCGVTRTRSDVREHKGRFSSTPSQSGLSHSSRGRLSSRSSSSSIGRSLQSFRFDPADALPASPQI